MVLPGNMDSSSAFLTGGYEQYSVDLKDTQASRKVRQAMSGAPHVPQHVLGKNGMEIIRQILSYSPGIVNRIMNVGIYFKFITKALNSVSIRRIMRLKGRVIRI